MHGPPLGPSKPMLQTQLEMSELASATVCELAGHDVQLGLLYADEKVLMRQAANHTTAKNNRSEERVKATVSGLIRHERAHHGCLGRTRACRSRDKVAGQALALARLGRRRCERHRVGLAAGAIAAAGDRLVRVERASCM